MTSVLGTYARKNISFVKGKGTYLYTKNGDKYLDWVCGIATNILGHCHPKLVGAVQNPIKKTLACIECFCNTRTRKISKKANRFYFCRQSFFYK